LRNSACFIFLDKLVLINLVNFENWIGIKKSFKLRVYNNKNLNELIFLIQNLTIFWELELLLRSSLKVIKKETEDSLLIIKFLFHKKKLFQNLNTLRFLQFPVFFSEKTKF
jgi:dipeptide/tripeptide permease